MNDSWDSPEGSGFIAGLKLRWRAWREHRRIVAEERRELRRFEAEERGFRPGGRPNFPNAADAPDSSFVKSASASRASSEESGLGPDSSRASGGFLAQWRASAQMRRQLREENKAIAADLSSEAAQGLSKRALIAALWDDLIRLRIPQWGVAVIPSIAFFMISVLPAMTETEAVAAEHVRMYQDKWPGLVSAGSWKDAELCGTRILDAGFFDVDDYFRYFECLYQNDDTLRAIRYLLTTESKIRSGELAKYRYRLAENLVRLPDIGKRPGLRNLAFSKLRESLAGPLSEDDEAKARQMLANVAIIQGNFDAAASFLEPIASRSPFVAADLLFLRFNQANDDDLTQIRTAASGLLVNIDTGRGAAGLSELSAKRARLRLLMILDREKEARDWLGSLKDLPDDDRKAIGLELEKLSLLTEGRKKPVKSDVLWTRLRPLLESEPNNQAWIRLALGMWAKDERQPGSELDRWVRDRLESDFADVDFLRLGSMATHMNGRWEDARSFYRKLIERQPNDVSALNNLAGLLYKFPPRDLNESLRLVEKALELAPKNLVILETKGQILARMGRFDEAREILASTIPTLPKEWNLHNTLAQIYDRAGDSQNAEAHRNILKSIPKPMDAERYAVLADFVKDSPKGSVPVSRP